MNISTKRIALDVKDIMSDPIDNIIYAPHEDLNNVGYVMIIGPKDTPYEHGFYFFEIHFTQDYPFVPPKVIFKTYDGKTRFNPNLYINGYVCLSLLNTWPGEKWSSCQSLRTILLCLSTLLNENPLLNEPGIHVGHRDIPPYNKIIHYRNIEVSILRCLNVDHLEECFKVFYPNIKEYFLKTYNEMNLDKPRTNEMTNIYNMYCEIDYSKLRQLLSMVYNELSKID
jgi:ubiquitin-conjugating enzyme E2 Z